MTLFSALHYPQAVAAMTSRTAPNTEVKRAEREDDPFSSLVGGLTLLAVTVSASVAPNTY